MMRGSSLYAIPADGDGFCIGHPLYMKNNLNGFYTTSFYSSMTT